MRHSPPFKCRSVDAHTHDCGDGFQKIFKLKFPFRTPHEYNPALKTLRLDTKAMILEKDCAIVKATAKVVPKGVRWRCCRVIFWPPPQAPQPRLPPSEWGVWGTGRLSLDSTFLGRDPRPGLGQHLCTPIQVSRFTGACPVSSPGNTSGSLIVFGGLVAWNVF